jgi:hypothetical protein
MFTMAEVQEHLLSFSMIPGLSQDLSINLHHRVRSQNPAIPVLRGNLHCFRSGQPDDMFFRPFPWQKSFISLAGDDFKAVGDKSEECLPAGGGRCQNQREFSFWRHENE